MVGSLGVGGWISGPIRLARMVNMVEWLDRKTRVISTPTGLPVGEAGFAAISRRAVARQPDSPSRQAGWGLAITLSLLLAVQPSSPSTQGGWGRALTRRRISSKARAYLPRCRARVGQRRFAPLRLQRPATHGLRSGGVEDALPNGRQLGCVGRAGQEAIRRRCAPH